MPTKLMTFQRHLINQLAVRIGGIIIGIASFIAVMVLILNHGDGGGGNFTNFVGLGVFMLFPLAIFPTAQSFDLSLQLNLPRQQVLLGMALNLIGYSALAVILSQLMAGLMSLVPSMTVVDSLYSVYQPNFNWQVATWGVTLLVEVLVAYLWASLLLLVTCYRLRFPGWVQFLTYGILLVGVPKLIQVLTPWLLQHHPALLKKLGYLVMAAVGYANGRYHALPLMGTLLVAIAICLGLASLLIRGTIIKKGK